MKIKVVMKEKEEHFFGQYASTYSWQQSSYMISLIVEMLLCYDSFGSSCYLTCNDTSG